MNDLAINASVAFDMRPRLCIVMPHHWALSSGGAEYQAFYLTRELLHSSKYQISFVARVAPAASASASEQVCVVGLRRSGERLRLGYLMDSLPLYRALALLRPDVIYQRVGCGYTAIAAYYARRNRIPMIWHASSDTDVSPAMLLGNTNRITRWLEKRSMEFGLRKASHIICQTVAQASLLEAHYGRQADAVISNFHPAPLESIDKSGPLTVLWVANLKRLKQPELFVRLADELRNLPQVRFVMIGSLPVEFRQDREWRERLLHGLKSSPNLQYVGPQTQAQVNEWLARSHVLVSTSLQEGFPNTFIQAWMRRVPVVSLHVDPDGVLARESIGLCVTSEAKLAEAVCSLVTDAARREQYGERARRYALQRHSLRNVQKVAQLIDECLEHKRSRV